MASTNGPWNGASVLSPRQLAAGLRLRPTVVSLPSVSEGAAVASIAFVIYLVVGAILAIGLNFVVGDAWSRVTNAYYVLFSRDPHLAAIGFVWNPLPSIMAIPLLPLEGLFPPLTRVGFVANLYSAIFMAGSVYLIWRIFLELGVVRWIRLILVAALALHPMIVQYGANGMTEALFLFLILGQTLYLIRWQRDGDLVPLVFAGVFLGIAYLVRYEAVAIGMATALLVAVVGFLQAEGGWRFRAKAALADSIVFIAPLALAFILWAGVSWLIVGSAFEQFGSVYGTTSQLAADYENIIYRASQGEVSLAYITGHLFILEPAFLALGIAAALLALWRRDVRVLPILGVLGAVLAFALAAFLTGKTGGWVRYYIAIIPLTVLAAGSLFSRREEIPAWLLMPLEWLRHPRRMLTRTRPIPGLRLLPAEAGWPPLRSRWMAPALSSLPPISLPRLTRPSISTPRISAARTSAARLRARLRIDRIRSDIAAVVGILLFLPVLTMPLAMISPRFNAASEFANDAGRVRAAAAVGETLDAMHLPYGSVLLDVFLGFGIVVNSDNPHQFVITPDRDFKAVLADPAAFGVRYLLVPPPDRELGELDAINRQYPSIYADGAGIATLVREFDEFWPYFAWRLYRLDE
jgi:Dolichyl-phosphate-mannose-protein mannosyltransferase